MKLSRHFCEHERITIDYIYTSLYAKKKRKKHWNASRIQRQLNIKFKKHSVSAFPVSTLRWANTTQQSV